MSRNIVISVVIVLIVLAVISFVRVYKAKEDMSGGRLSALSLLAGLFIGAVTNILTAYLTAAIVETNAVTLVPVDAKNEVGAAVPFSVSGVASLSTGSELWLIAYRPGSGFEFLSRRAIPVDSEGRWTFEQAVVGRAAGPGSRSLDYGATYRVAAVVVSEDGAAEMEQIVNSAEKPTGSVFVRKSEPPGLIVQDIEAVTVR